MFFWRCGKTAFVKPSPCARDPNRRSRWKHSAYKSGVDVATGRVSLTTGATHWCRIVYELQRSISTPYPNPPQERRASSAELPEPVTKLPVGYMPGNGTIRSLRIANTDGWMRVVRSETARLEQSP